MIEDIAAVLETFFWDWSDTADTDAGQRAKFQEVAEEIWDIANESYVGEDEENYSQYLG